MDNLTDVYNQFASIDDELEKQASEMVKQAEEEEFAGRIMARGFADELNKLAQPQQFGSAGMRGIQGAGPARGKTPMAEAPTQMDFSKSEGSKIKARSAAPKQTRAQAISHAKGIAGMAKGIGKGLGPKPPASPLVAKTQ
jgi:hypothetical protein